MRRPATQLPDASRALIGYKTSNTKPLTQWERAWHIGWSDVTVSALTTQQSHNSSAERSEVQCALWAGTGGHGRVDKEGVKELILWFYLLNCQWKDLFVEDWLHLRISSLGSKEFRATESNMYTGWFFKWGSSTPKRQGLKWPSQKLLFWAQTS